MLRVCDCILQPLIDGIQVLCILPSSFLRSLLSYIVLWIAAKEALTLVFIDLWHIRLGVAMLFRSRGVELHQGIL